MNKSAYAVFDSKAKFFTAPFFCVNDMVALRLFAGAVGDPATDLHKFPSDYTLFRVGMWDDEKGAITPLSPLENLGIAAQFVARADMHGPFHGAAAVRGNGEYKGEV